MAIPVLTGPSAPLAGRSSDPISVKAGGEVRDRRSCPGAVPGDVPGAMVLCIRVGILPGDELERVNVLAGESVTQRRENGVVVSELSRPGRAADSPRRVLMSCCARGRQCRDDSALRWGKRREKPGKWPPFRGRWPAWFALREAGSTHCRSRCRESWSATGNSEAASFPHRQTDAAPVLVLAGRFHLSDLEERPCRENAVVVAPENISVNVRAWPPPRVDNRGRLLAEFGAEVTLIDLKLPHDRSGGSQPNVEFLERVVVDEVELDIFVAAAFSRAGVGCPSRLRAVRSCSAWLATAAASRAAALSGSAIGDGSLEGFVVSAGIEVAEDC